jgi:hypothetical protein
MTAPRTAQTADIRRIRQRKVGGGTGVGDRFGNFDALIGVLAPGKLSPSGV